MMVHGKSGEMLMILLLFRNSILKFCFRELTQIGTYFTMALAINYGVNLHVRNVD